jgi:hypothetical protein
MTVFWSLAAVMVMVALLFVLPPLLRKRELPAVSGDDLLVTLACLNHVIDFGTQVVGKFGIGICQRLVLANQATKFFNKVLEVLLFCLGIKLECLKCDPGMRGTRAE